MSNFSRLSNKKIHHTKSFLGKGLQQRHLEQLSSQGNRLLISRCCQAWRQDPVFCWKAGNPQMKDRGNGARTTRLTGPANSMDTGAGFHRRKATESTGCTEICNFNFDRSFWYASCKAGKIWSSHSAPSTQQTVVHLMRSQKKTFLLPFKGNPLSRPVGTIADNFPGWAIQLQSRNHQCFLWRSPNSAAWLCI